MKLIHLSQTGMTELVTTQLKSELMDKTTHKTMNLSKISNWENYQKNLSNDGRKFE